MPFLKISLPALTTDGMESMKLIFVLLAAALSYSVTGKRISQGIENARKCIFNFIHIAAVITTL
jgi:hypothetical protein